MVQYVLVEQVQVDMPEGQHSLALRVEFLVVEVVEVQEELVKMERIHPVLVALVVQEQHHQLHNLMLRMVIFLQAVAVAVAEQVDQVDLPVQQEQVDQEVVDMVLEQMLVGRDQALEVLTAEQTLVAVAVDQWQVRSVCPEQLLVLLVDLVL
jgi:hypothetical protein